MSEDYTYEPLNTVTVERSELDYLRAELSRVRRRIAELEGEVAGLTNGRADLIAALQQSEAENASLRAGIANIRQHGGIIAAEVERLPELLEIKRKVERAYDLYRYNAEYVGVEPLSFAEWFDMVSGENEELPESIIANGDVLLDNIAG